MSGLRTPGSVPGTPFSRCPPCSHPPSFPFLIRPRRGQGLVLWTRTSVVTRRTCLSPIPPQGVDLVLNSLAEEKLQASVRCLAQHGRFLEIGKFDLSNNHQLGEPGRG